MTQDPEHAEESAAPPQLDVPEVVDVEEYKPSGSELVVHDPTDRQEALVVLDRHTERDILDELQRRALKVMLYEVPIGGSKEVDLSYQGVNEAVRLLNAMGGQRIGIRPDSREVRREAIDGVEYVVVSVMSENEVDGYRQFGVSMEPVWMKVGKDKATKYRREGTFPVREETIGDSTVYRTFDVYAETKALNKAQRNALKVQIPEAMRQTLIAMYKGQPDRIKVIQAGAGAAETAELPPPLNDEKALAQKQEARELYTEIKEYAPGGLDVQLPPARFHGLMARAEHDHARLDDFLGFLRDTLETAKTKAAA